MWGHRSSKELPAQSKGTAGFDYGVSVLFSCPWLEACRRAVMWTGSKVSAQGLLGLTASWETQAPLAKSVAFKSE